MSQVIVVGGGLAGMSAAHTVLQAGGRVLVLDKSAFCGGNSTKATSGINAAGSRTQRKLGNPDAAEIFERDTAKSAGSLLRPNLVKALTHQSGPAVDWLMDAFGLDLTVVSRLAAHSHPRTHRGSSGGQFPGMMITYQLMEELDKIAESNSNKARVINKATVTKLIENDAGCVIGCEYEKGGATFKEYGPVVISTGGFGADFTDGSLLSKVEQEWRSLDAWKNGVPLPPLRSLSTTNGPHCTGDGIKISTALGAATADLHCVQVHPTGLTDPRDPAAKVKWLAAEALRGHGGLLLDREGQRFCNELGKRDYVTGRMWKHNKGPYRLVLSSAATSEIDWHCEHYKGRGLMKKLTGRELAAEIGVAPRVLDATFRKYRENVKNDEWGKLFCNNPPTGIDDVFHVAIVGPVIHYCMGGVAADESGAVIREDGSRIPGLFAAGEVIGGIHGANRLGGSSLLDCVVFGRISGASASKYLLGNLIAQKSSLPGTNVTVNVSPDGKVTVTSNGSVVGSSTTEAAAVPAAEKVEAVKATPTLREITPEEVARHTKKNDCWVVLNNQVYDVTEFLPDHPGGKNAILLYGGKDATKEFNMLHKPEIIEKYGKQYHIGTLVTKSKL